MFLTTCDRLQGQEETEYEMTLELVERRSLKMWWSGRGINKKILDQLTKLKIEVGTK